MYPRWLAETKAFGVFVQPVMGDFVTPMTARGLCNSVALQSRRLRLLLTACLWLLIRPGAAGGVFLFD